MKRKLGSGYLQAMIVLGATIVASAAAAPPSHEPYPVTSTVFDTDGNGTPLTLQSDALNPPGYAVYQNDDASGVTTYISAGASDWWLNVRTSSRVFFLTLVDLNDNAIDGLPAGRQAYAGHIVSRCFTTSAGNKTSPSWFGMGEANPNCGMRVGFTYGSTDYALVMSPGYAGTGRAEVYCNARNGSSCVDWTILPNQNANAGVANLYRIDRRGRETYVATCRLTFRMHVTYP